MEETVLQEETKTFSQEEVNAIVGDRLKREREKYADYESLREKAAKLDEIEEASKSELQKATERAQQLEAELNGLRKADELRKIRESVANETGVPANLLSGEDEETLKSQAMAIKAYATNGNAYPQIKDGGEVITPQTGSPKNDFMQFAAAMND